MFLPTGFNRTATVAALAGLLWIGTGPLGTGAQEAAHPRTAGNDAANELAEVPLPNPQLNAIPLPEDRGAAAVAQVLRRLSTTASILFIVAHPDDEDGSLLTYLSRGHGVRATLMTLNRGEGGQNLMSADENDALGIIRTNELLKADSYYGVKQLWGSEVDFGFSKTQEEAFKLWGHQRVLYDAVLAVRRTRPQIVASTFVGGITDGHGQHQVSGEMAQEVFKAAGDPKVFPEQLKNGLEPWQPLAVYSRTPFARITGGKMFDYATGKWAPARFHNYATGQWTTSPPTVDVSIPVGTYDPALGRTYVQIARQGWGEQKSQNGGSNPVLGGPDESEYHLWAVAPEAKGKDAASAANDDVYHNSKVEIDTSIVGIARLAGSTPPAWLTESLRRIQTGIAAVQSTCPCGDTVAAAHKLVPPYREVLGLRARVAASSLSAEAKSNVLFQLDAKIDQFQDAFRNLLGLGITAFRTGGVEQQRGPFPGRSAEETSSSVTPGESFYVRMHTFHAAPGVQLEKAWFVSETGSKWQNGEAVSTDHTEMTENAVFKVQVPENAEPTKPYFTRPDIEQAYYDISNPAWREDSFAPWPLAAWAEFSFDGVPIRIGEVVQTLQRVTGPGGFYEPLVVTPAIGVRVEPQARILPLNGGPLPVRVNVHGQSASDGMVELKVPAGWKADPAQAKFHVSGGETQALDFSVTPAGAENGAYDIEAVAEASGKTYRSGWRSVGYAGLRPYNLYRPAVLKTRKVDVKVAPGLRVGYVMGSGDTVPEAISELGVTPHLLTAAELTSGDLSAFDTIVIGIRAYSVRPELAGAEPRLEQYVRNGGTLIVQYQSGSFPAPLPLTLTGRPSSNVVDETDPVKLLDASNPLLSRPNRIEEADFNGWVEERGHGFAESWASGYAALTETADPGQDSQRGGLLAARVGKGTFVYVAYALYRQLPELVPGSYRILANLISAGHGSE
ncbi:MAG TPA: PIG-L family deacetylase [Terracidiphilus sp.]|nr:PIG-L family deacetylase [Terracidiphilus sp.]